MRRAKLPLNSDAVNAADQALYNNHPELNGRKLTMGPADGGLRKEWMDAYLAAGGAAAPPCPTAPPGQTTVPCPATPGPTPSPTPGHAGPRKPCEQPQASAKGGNTTVQVDRKNKKVIIRSKLEYSGPDASQAYADHARAEIEKTWKGTVQVDGETYTVETHVDTVVTPTGPPTPGYDQIVVDKTTNRMTQSLYGAGPGSQTPDAADPNRRRISHEYGHTLGLPDEYHDDPTTGAAVKDDPAKLNNIMAETWPDDSGKMPYPHEDQFQQVLKNYGCKQ